MALVIAGGIAAAGAVSAVTTSLDLREFHREAVRVVATVDRYSCPNQCPPGSDDDRLEVSFPAVGGTASATVAADHEREPGSLVEIRLVPDEPHGIVVLASQEPQRPWFPFALLGVGLLGSVIVWRTTA